jgi:MFS family permease
MQTRRTTSAHDRVTGRGRRGLVLALGLATTVVSMTQTLMIPILGRVQDELELSASALSWVTTATLLSAAVSTPLLSRLGDQRGARAVLLGVLLLTVFGSVLAAAANSLPLLLTGRVTQGTATAIFPLALTVLRAQLPPAQLPTAIGLVSGTLAAGSGLALVGAGLLTQDPGSGYRPVFWLAAAVSALALLAVAVALPRAPARRGARTDWPGAAGLALTLFLLLLGLSMANMWGWSSARILATFVAAVVAGTVWAVVERRVTAPMVDMVMFLRRPVLWTNIAGLLLGFGMFTQFIGISALVQTPREIAGYGFSASALTAATVYLLPSTLASLVAAQVSGVLVGRIGARVSLAGGAATGVVGFGWLAFAHDSSGSVIVAGILTGIAVSFGFATLPAFIVAGVPAHQNGIANGINSIARSVGSAVASAVITTLLATHTLPGASAGSPPVPTEEQYTLVFALGAVAFTVIVLLALGGPSATATQLNRTPAGPGTPCPATTN